jgi:lycopene cyclase domain-containing protein
MMWLYLGALLFAIVCLMMIDRRFKLAFWYDVKRTSFTLGISVVLFIIWDILGISFGIFFDGSSAYMSPVRLMPHFPLEEIFFLFLLMYVTLIVYRGAGKRWPRI